jgi:hypothetical protein
MTAQFIYNPTDSPVVIDGEGRTIAGREWGWADSKDVGDALDSGRLVKVDKPGKDASKQAQAAYEAKPIRGARSDAEKE